MKKTIALVGATGDLGLKVLKYLQDHDAHVRCLVRFQSDPGKLALLKEYGAEIVYIEDFNQAANLASALKGAEVLVSTLSGLRPVIVDLQKKLLDAAVKAGVPRMIPSDYAIDYRKIPMGENRNLNLRWEFMRILDQAPIQATSILNGAFIEMLSGVAPFILYPIRAILCWGDKDQLMDWTTTENTAEYTAYAAMDDNAPRFLKIAGSEMSAHDFRDMMKRITGKTHFVLKPGGPETLARLIKLTQILAPGKGEIYPVWQGMQYMHNMYVGTHKHASLDNGRYPIHWTTCEDHVRLYLEKSTV